MARRKKTEVAPPAAAAPEPVAVVRPAPSHDQIARRAYELYVARGGTAFDNWLEAERLLREEG
jgi:hypothetical protein